MARLIPRPGVEARFSTGFYVLATNKLAAQP
jgi:hypothetical protein